MTETRDLAKVEVVSSFAKEWAICSRAGSILHIKASIFNIFPPIESVRRQEITSVEDIPKDTLFDLILGDFPLGLHQSEWNDDSKTVRAQRNWLDLLQSLVALERNGTALVMLEPLGFSTSRGAAFERELNDRGFYLNAMFRAPENLLRPEALVTPVFGSIAKTPTDRLFVAELLDTIQAQQVVRSYFSNVEGPDLARGMYIDPKSYFGFHQIKIKQQIERLETQYKNYERYSLGDLALEVNHVSFGEQFRERNNAIYIPSTVDAKVVFRLEDLTMAHHSYFQVVLSESAINEYVASFFRSTLGRLILDSLTSGSAISRLNQRDIQKAVIALPDLSEQRNILKTHHKLENLRAAIDGFDEELALNPTSSSSILKQLDTMLSVIGSLSEADRVRALVREGESKVVEFKETLSLDVRKQTKEKYIEESALKTVVAFLNTDGGKLLIGVSDDGKIPGLNTEIDKFHQNLDKFLLHWKNLVKTRIGEEYYPCIDYRTVNVDGSHVLLVECKPSPIPCYLDRNDFYVRTNPATDKLEGPKLVEYVRYHFKVFG